MIFEKGQPFKIIERRKLEHFIANPNKPGYISSEPPRRDNGIALWQDSMVSLHQVDATRQLDLDQLPNSPSTSRCDVLQAIEWKQTKKSAEELVQWHGWFSPISTRPAVTSYPLSNHHFSKASQQAQFAVLGGANSPTASSCKHKLCWAHKRIHCAWGPKPRRIY